MNKYTIILILAAFALGFFLRGLTVQKGEKVEYVKGETATATVPKNLLKVKAEFKGELMDLPLIFIKKDTISSIEYVYPDTAAIINDFMMKRMYDFEVFNDTRGILNVSPIVQFNRIQDFSYTFTPITKTITRTKERVFVPFVSASYSTFDIVGIGGGFFYNNVGIEYNYQADYLTKKNGHLVGIKVKF